MIFRLIVLAALVIALSLAGTIATILFLKNPPAFVSRYLFSEKAARWNTIYSDNFSLSNLDKLQVGMSADEVVSILGEPISRQTGMYGYCFSYAQSRIGSFASTHSISVCFDEHQRYVKTYQHIL